MGKKTILVIEDDESVRNGLLRAIEEDETYHAVAVENAIVALDWLSKNQKPDAIISDFIMLGGGASIVSIAERMQIPTIIVSALPEDAKKAAVSLFSKIPVFAKPFDVWEVLNAIDYLTDTKVA